jgi:cyanophycinase-like exopeptidase
MMDILVTRPEVDFGLYGQTVVDESLASVYYNEKHVKIVGGKQSRYCKDVASTAFLQHLNTDVRCKMAISGTDPRTN